MSIFVIFHFFFTNRFIYCFKLNFHFRPVSAYAMFFRDTQAAIKGQNPAATFGDISKIVAAMWDNLDDKTKAVSINL